MLSVADKINFMGIFINLLQFAQIIYFSYGGYESNKCIIDYMKIEEDCKIQYVTNGVVIGIFIMVIA